MLIVYVGTPYDMVRSGCWLRRLGSGLLLTVLVGVSCGVVVARISRKTSITKQAARRNSGGIARHEIGGPSELGSRAEVTVILPEGYESILKPARKRKKGPTSSHCFGTAGLRIFRVFQVWDRRLSLSKKVRLKVVPDAERSRQF